MNSLRARVALLWAVLAAICVTMLLVLRSAGEAGPAALVERAQAAARDACAGIGNAVDRLVPPSDDGTTSLMDVVLDLSLRDADGIEGGLWDKRRGFTAYAYPSYGGQVRKTDVPAAETASIAALAEKVGTDGESRVDVRRGTRESVVIAACGLPRDQVAWTLTRIASAQASAMQHVTIAAALSLGVVVVAGAWLLLGLRAWSQQLSVLERELGGRVGETSRVAPSGERDLDRLVLAFNTSAARVESLNAESERLAAELAHADRLAALGRVAAGLAHEIRNPLGSMRLRAENALAVQGPAAFERRGAALDAVLATVDRLDGLVTSLLALTRPARPDLQPTPLGPWLGGAIDQRVDQAVRQSVRLGGHCLPENLVARIDSAALARALDNLLLNALQHTPAGGRIDVAIEALGARWRLTVDDSGPGIAMSMRDHLFEPFATDRATGTGLGLAAARETVVAHGGTLRCATSPEGGARFEWEMPCLES